MELLELQTINTIFVNSFQMNVQHQNLKFD